VAKVSEDRVDELLRQARAAADRKDWQVALAAASRAVAAAATVDVRDRAGVEQKRIQGLMPKTATDGGVAPEPPAPPPGGAPPGGSPRDPGRPPAEPPAAKKPTASAHDDEATELFRASRKAMEAGRFGSAERGFYRLLAEYRDAKIVRDYEQEVLHRLDEAYEKGRGVAGLFEGSVHVKGSRVALTYTFDDPAEAKDWETVHPFQVPQKGKFTVAGGELAGEGAAAFQHRAAFRTDGVSMSFRILPGAPAQDMGAMMVEPKDPVNHLLFTIANEFFKLGKGKEAYAVPGNVIFVFGKGMWRSTDPGMAGFVKTAASEEPKVQPRKWAEIEVAKERDKARFTIEGKSLNGRAIGDNKYEITGVRPALFVLLSEARFDDVTVEGEPDPDWARAEHERLFPTLK
jgi:hypothetical protein